MLIPIALGRARDASRGGWRTAWTVVAALWFYSSWCGMMSFHCAAACGLALLVFRDGVLPTPLWIAIGATWLALLGLGIVVTRQAVFVPAETRDRGARDPVSRS